jgi:triosephosphate isomerase
MKYIVANFKMNPERREDMEAWVEKFFEFALVKRGRDDQVRVVLCPPFVWLPIVANRIAHSANRYGSGALRLAIGAKPILGAQDVFWEMKGPYTGEISPAMLKSVGCEYVIVGHSERRTLGETDEMINRKIKAALKAGLKVILAVGESARAGTDDTRGREVGPALKDQLVKALSGVARTKIGDLIVAYEPLWAVGTGIAATPEDALKAALFIRKCVGKITGSAARAQELAVLYGGSVTSKNAASFLGEEVLQGVLVGGASLSVREFLKIVEISSMGSNRSG